GARYFAASCRGGGADQRSAAVSSEALASTQVFSTQVLSPPILSPPVLSPTDSTCFQNGARVFKESIRNDAAAQAASRRLEAVATSTMTSPGSSRPKRWITVTPSSGQRA